MSTLDFIRPDWPAPPSIHAVSTTRIGGISEGPYATLNLGARTGDDATRVRTNRERLRDALPLPDEPLWLAQEHGVTTVHTDTVTRDETAADAVWTDRPGQVCAVLTADCLPVLLCADDGSRVAAVHAGWRGLAAGVIESAIDAMDIEGAGLHAWLGPAIGPAAFEVGSDVRTEFLRADPHAYAAFRPSPEGGWLADLYTLAQRRLAASGVTSIHGGGYCTSDDGERFFSYRRDGTTGRMATLIWR